MGRRPRADRDPKAPKAAVSAQQFFNKKRREVIKNREPDIKSAAMMERLAEEWRNLDAKGRAPFVKEALKDKDRFNKENAKYVPDPEFLRPTKGGKRLQKDPLKPKKPKSAYLFFGEATRQELAQANPGIRIDTLSKLIGEEWKKLSDSAKRPYIKMADDDKKRYETAMAKYEPSEEYKAAQAAFKAKRKRLKKGLPVDDDDDEGVDTSELEAENADLKKQVKELEKKTEQLEKKIEKLETKLEKEGEKLEKAKEKAKAKAEAKAAAGAKRKAEPKAEPAKKAAKTSASSAADYEKWCMKVLGKNGEKMDAELQKIFDKKGEAGLSDALAKRYAKEMKGK